MHLLQMGPSKVLTTFPLQIQSSWQLSLLELPPSVTLGLPPRTPLRCIPLLYNLVPPLLMQYSCPTLVSKSFIPHLPIMYLLLLPPHLRPLLLAVLLRFLPPLPLTLTRFFNGMLEVFESGALNYFTFSQPILVNLICIQESNLNSSSSFQIPGFSALHSDCTHFRSGILSPDATHAGGGVVIFVRQGLSFSELSTSSLSLLDPYSDYVGVNISLNNSSLLSFLNVYAPLFAPPHRMTELTPFLPPFFPPREIVSFWGTSIAITPLGPKRHF